MSMTMGDIREYTLQVQQPNIRECWTEFSTHQSWDHAGHIINTSEPIPGESQYSETLECAVLF